MVELDWDASGGVTGPPVLGYPLIELISSPSARTQGEKGWLALAGCSPRDRVK